MSLSESILNQLNPPQRQAVTHGQGPLLILAGAGSGKTRVVTYRMAHLLSEGVSPWNILAVTFTNKAAAEMRHRVDTITDGQGRGVWISTFHSFCAQFLRIEAKPAGLDPNYVIYDDNDQTQLIKECLRELSLDDKKFKTNQIISVISRAKDDLLDAESYGIHSLAQNDPFRQTVASIYNLYEKKMKKANALDFGDLIMKSVMALRDNDALREKYRQRFQYILVDEYQDTNHAQYLLIKHMVGAQKNICVVGDDDQSVYSWRGADIRNIMEFERDYGGATVVKLEQNYRSTEAILDVAYNVIKRNRFRKEKKLWTDKKGGEPVLFHEFANEQEEARFVATEVLRRTQAGTAQARDAAVFYRTNAQSRVLEDAFRREGLPYKIVGGMRFYERMEVKDIMSYLRLLVNPADSVSCKRIVNVPARGIGKTSIQALDNIAAAKGLTFLQAIQDSIVQQSLPPAARGNLQKFLDILTPLAEKIDKLSAADMVQAALEETGYWAHWESQVDSDPEAAARLDNLQELVNAAKEFEEANQEDKTTQSFLEKIALASDLDKLDAEGGTVTLMTVHLAKGLEFPLVFLTGLEEGLFPIGESAFEESELEEERRLCYVGMTRAETHLFITSSASRRIYGRSHWNVPSRFVSEAGLRPEKDAATDGAVPSHHAEAAGGVIGAYDPDEDAATVPQGAQRPLKVGMRVRHPNFGEGKILQKTGHGDQIKVKVLFNSGARKDIMARYANFEFL